ncbi:MAG: McrC family protein [Anaeroplasmataceae bacterium]
MKTLFEVREFDVIVNNNNFVSNPKYKFLENDNFNNLLNYIKEFNSKIDNAHASDFFKIGWKKSIGDTISINKYVGLIQLRNGFQIQILPKLSLSSVDNDNKLTKQVFTNMLKSLKEFKGKSISIANLNTSKLNIYEIFINMYIQEADNLVKNGLKSSYISSEDNTNIFKGKLSIKDQIKYNHTHKERFYVLFDEFEINRSENKLIKSTLLKLLTAADSLENKNRIKKLLTSFDMVEPSSNYVLDFCKVNLSRNMLNYKQILNWSKIFLYNQSFTSFAGEASSKSLLFPMDQLFESYVSKYMKKILTPKGYCVSTQDKGYYLFNLPVNKFSLRPDIVIRKNEQTIIFDTKWKKISSKISENYGISQSDMYQMYAYANKYSNNSIKPEVWLLYPYNNEIEFLQLPKFESEDGIVVRLFFIKLDSIEESINELLQLI